MSRDSKTWTTLFRATLNGDLDAAREALDQGADPNHAPMPEMSPALSATRLGHDRVLELMFERGLAFGKGDQIGRMCWMWAKALGMTETLAILTRNGVRPSLFDRLTLPLVRSKLVEAAAKLDAERKQTNAAPSDVRAAPTSTAASASSDPTEFCEEMNGRFLSTMRQTAPPEFAEGWDHSEASLARVDEAISAMWGDESPTMLEPLVMTWGAYVALTLKNVFDGRIDVEEDDAIAVVFRTPSGHEAAFRPFTWIHKRFVNGPEDSVAHKIAAMRASMDQLAVNAGGVR